MNRRFSDEEMYNVRNRIPIRHVIENLLAIPSETVHGVFRFRCPLCAGRHTAIKPETNLSRCFDCEKNFNTIDLCMLVRRTDRGQRGGNNNPSILIASLFGNQLCHH
jgi:hypothetical protein